MCVCVCVCVIEICGKLDKSNTPIHMRDISFFYSLEFFQTEIIF